MPLPELAGLLSPEHFRAFEAHLESYILDRIEGAVGHAFGRVVKRWFRSYLPADDIEVLRIRVDRLDEVIAGIASGQPDETDPIREANGQDPAFEDYLSSVVASATATGSEGKRLLMGRLAAIRSRVTTSTFDDQLMREALRIADQVRIPQLYALGALYLLTDLPYPGRAALEIYKALDAHYYSVLVVLISEQWTEPDLRYLNAIGAIAPTDRGEHIIMSRLEQELQPAGKYWPIPMGVNTHDKFLSIATQLDGPVMRGQSARNASVASWELTPAGSLLGQSVVDSLRGPSASV